MAEAGQQLKIMPLNQEKSEVLRQSLPVVNVMNLKLN